MNKALISNPFLCPPSGDNNEETKELFRTRASIVKDYILFTIQNFEQAWRSEEDLSSGRNSDVDLFPGPLASPTVSTTTTELVSPLDFEMEDELFSNLENFDLNNYQFSPIQFENDLEKGKEDFTEISKPNLNCNKTEEGLSNIDAVEPTLFPLPVQINFVEKSVSEIPQMTGPNMQSNQLISGESMWLGDNGFDSLLDISANDPDPPVQPSLADPSIVIPSFDVHQSEVKVTADVNSISTTLSRQKRKPNLVTRAEFSPATFEGSDESSIDLRGVEMEIEVKPVALVSLNGPENRTRHISTSSSITAMASPSSSKLRANKSGERKRPRKYELDDPSDPSVKNAKAAKMNRDKKKLQMQALQKRVAELTEENKVKTQELNELRSNSAITQQQYEQEIGRLNNMLMEEKGKNSANSRQKVTMFDLIQKVVSVVTPSPSVICVTERLAATPMPDLNEMESIRLMSQASSTPANGTDTYLTFKVGIGGIPSITFDCENRPQMH